MESFKELNKEILQRIEYLMDDEQCGDDMSDKSRNILIKENQSFLVRVQGLMLRELNDGLEKPNPTNWLGKWAKSKHDERVKNGEDIILPDDDLK